MTAVQAKLTTVGLGIAMIAIPGLFYLLGGGLNARTIVAFWLAGAAALGLVSGFTTGASEATTAGSEFLKFLSGGVVVPLFGGLAALFRLPQKTTETLTYNGDQLATKVVETALSSTTAHLQPLAVLGSFFVMYCAFAIFGIVLGQTSDIKIKKAG